MQLNYEPFILRLQLVYSLLHLSSLFIESTNLLIFRAGSREHSIEPLLQSLVRLGQIRQGPGATVLSFLVQVLE
jgi:hypothetical protein